MRDALTECQRTTTVHKRYVRLLVVRRNADSGAFFEDLWKDLPHVLATKKVKTQRAGLLLLRLLTSSPILQGVAEADRLVKFVVALSVERDEGGEEVADAFLERMIETLLPLCLASDKSVRLRAASMLAGMMNGLDGEAELSNELFDKLTETMRDRLRDRAPEVRAHAARALARLQVRATQVSAKPIPSPYVREIMHPSSTPDRLTAVKMPRFNSRRPMTTASTRRARRPRPS